MAGRQIRQTIHDTSTVAHGTRQLIELSEGSSLRVPGCLLLPAAAATAAPVPAALLLHGYSSRKEDLSLSIGTALLAHGVASLAIDLPLHGSRADPVQAQSARNPLVMMQLWRQALADAKLGIHYLAARQDIDRSALAIIGYSMGSFLSVLTAADMPQIRAVVLAAGGDLPANTPFAGVARMVADPLRAVKKLNGRPLLMLHGRRDRTVTPQQAERLFAAAREPKELRWLDCGHYLPPAAAEIAATWLQERLGTGLSSA